MSYVKFVPSKTVPGVNVPEGTKEIETGTTKCPGCGTLWDKKPRAGYSAYLRGETFTAFRLAVVPLCADCLNAKTRKKQRQVAKNIRKVVQTTLRVSQNLN